MGPTLFDYQLDALSKLRNGCVLKGGVGSGKSITAVAWYYTLCGGSVECLTGEKFEILPSRKRYPLYIITTARKRDTKEWEAELEPFGIFATEMKPVVIDSWNNIQKYTGVADACFIFDEQRAVGRGKWSKTFIKIAKKNKWILLSATPGDNWNDYVPLFIANGFYRNRTDFNDQHVIWNPHVPYQQILKYYNTGLLIKYRKSILVEMKYETPAECIHEDIVCEYDKEMYHKAMIKRWNVYKGAPIVTAGEYCQVLRRIVNSDKTRCEAFLRLCGAHEKVIVFYTYNYERDIIIEALNNAGVCYAEWTGFKHEPVPDTERWVYLVEYNSGAEGWNCTKTDTMIFFDESYSYKQMVQAAGRIDRNNTPYKKLYYYHLRSRSSIDNSIRGSLMTKKKFNEKDFAPKGLPMYEKTIQKNEETKTYQAA